ncbi:hypothetical protein WMY93_005459 [Mugilogobius chulae]|uniref:Translation initiation factor 5A C-terminal domain-containing protein n=1 Tax=Mugilogobius chulae TaxID=88201 RepID=A0AAW0PSN6_9GOBI
MIFYHLSVSEYGPLRHTSLTCLTCLSLTSDFAAHTAQANMSSVTVKSSDLEEGGYVILKGRPCQILKMNLSQRGKHGDQKVELLGRDVFTGQEREDAVSTAEDFIVPAVTQQNYQVASINHEGFVYTVGYEKSIPLPSSDLGDEIRDRHGNGQDIMVTVVSAMGEEAIVAVISVDIVAPPTFSLVCAAAANTTQANMSSITVKSSDLEEGGYVILNGRPCQILKMNLSQRGKHGDQKVELLGRDVFTGQEHEDAVDSIKHGGFLYTVGNEKPIQLPRSELGYEISDRHHNGEDIMVTVVSAMGEEAIVAVISVDIVSLPAFSLVCATAANTTQVNMDQANMDQVNMEPVIMDVSALKEGGYACIKGRPCKILKANSTQQGKHGESKVVLVYRDLFTQEENEDAFPRNSEVEVPVVQR